MSTAEALLQLAKREGLPWLAPEKQAAKVISFAAQTIDRKLGKTVK